MKSLVLSGDVGGTKTNLALVPALARGRIGRPVALACYGSADFPSLAAMIDVFLREHGPRDGTPRATGSATGAAGVAAASFGFAGVVADGRGAGTHVPWTVEATLLARHLSLPRAHLVNDLVALGYAIPALAPEDLRPVHEGAAAADGNVAVVAPGTGLGETVLLRVDEELVPVPSEGGHADFAPRTDLEIEVFRALRDRLGRVSYEHILSGPGLANVASVLHAREGAGAVEDHARGVSGEGMPGAISRNALSGSCACCVRSLDFFAGVLGAEAGNIALRGLARSGVYLGGGIVPRILPALLGPTFREAFLAKEPHRALLERIPVWAILNDHAPVLGAARYATLAERLPP